MSYHVELPATVRDCDSGSSSSYSVGTFAGGPEHGPMVQITLSGPGGYVTLTRKQQAKLRKVLKAAKKGSLYGYPGAR